MKKLLSFLLAVLMISVTTVTAFAEDTNSENTEEGSYSSLEEAKNYVLSMVDRYREHFIYYDYNTPLEVPIWSNTSLDNIENILDYIEKTIIDCSTIDEVVELNNLLDKAEDEMCIDSSELKWMLEYMKKDYESVGYYDEDTIAEIKTIYEQAQSDYNSGVEKQIHTSYVALRNLLNKLCLYNNIAGDVNNDGKLTIEDITLMQKSFAGLTKLNSSQNYISELNEHSNIDIVTSWQKELANMTSNSYTAYVNKQLDKLNNSEILDSNNKYFVFTPYTEQDNYMYWDDCYYPWWPIN